MNPALVPVVMTVVDQASRYVQGQKNIELAAAELQLHRERDVINARLTELSLELRQERVREYEKTRRLELENEHKERLRQFELIEQALNLARQTVDGQLSLIRESMQSTFRLVENELPHIRAEISRLNDICYSDNTKKKEKILARKQINDLRKSYHQLLTMAEHSRVDALYHSSNIQPTLISPKLISDG